MNAQTSILPDDAEVIRQRLIRVRDTALTNSVRLQHGWAREANVLLAEVSNYMASVDAPLAAMQDAFDLCRTLIRAQNIAGTLEGIYPTDRYQP